MRPEQARILAERNIMPARGPRFFREGGKVMFEFVIDTANRIGPHPASRRDQADHAGAWEEFCRREDVSPLDRDASGSVGGSLPVDHVADAVAASFQSLTDKPAEPQLSPQVQGGVKPRRGRPPKVRS